MNAGHAAANGLLVAMGRNWDPPAAQGFLGSAWQVAKFLAVLALVVALVVITTRLLGRRLVMQRTGRHLELVETLSLGPNRALCLARAADRLLVLGVSEGGISRLLLLPAAATTRQAAPGGGGPAPGASTGAPSTAAQPGVLPGEGPGSEAAPEAGSRGGSPPLGFLGRLLGELRRQIGLG
ncbi:MAG: flagellar biosynthetic protein FliO [Acetobacteraceae bacterium]|nr:flagellar biosynthetic protein FliO [Acetobacteraceae bacterium]